jgi:hypothetical protein
MTHGSPALRRRRPTRVGYRLTRGLIAAALSAVAVLLHGCSTAPSRIAALPGTARVQPENFVVVTLRNDSASPNPYAGSTARGYRAPGPYRASAAALAAVRGIATQHHLREVSAWPIELLGVHCVVFELAAGSERERVIGALRADSAVETAQPLARFELQAATAVGPYNDTYAALQRNLVEMDIAAAHRRSRGDGVRVALVDTGVDTAHPDFGGRLGAVRDFVLDGSSFEERHGTAVAGVIAAEPNNGIGIAGIAPRAELMALRACWSDPGGSGEAAGGACNSYTLAQALVAALDGRAAIVNLSLTGPGDPLLERIVTRALRRGTVVVGALPANGRREGFPTAIGGVIAVGSATDKSAVASRILRAPGTDVFTLSPRSRYDAASGSSLAAASVTAVAALALSLQPTLTASQLEATLARSMNGGSAVNACAALRELVPGTACRETPADAGVAR